MTDQPEVTFSLKFDLDKTINADTAKAVSLVVLERRRQIAAKGYTREHDDEMGVGHLVVEAKSSLDLAAFPETPEAQRKELVRAATLLIAAIEVVDRTIPEQQDEGSK